MSPIGIALLTWKVVVFAALVLAWWVRRRLNRAVTGLHQQLRATYGEAEAAERLQFWSVILEGYHGVPITCPACGGPFLMERDRWRCDECGEVRPAKRP